jgi:DNA polymerase I
MKESFREVWAADFEFGASPGERPDVRCLVARELKTGRTVRLWRDQLGPVPPYPTDAGSLFVAYYASAELGCHLALGWPLPERVLDLYVEFRNRTNGIPTIAGNGLIGALAAHGLDSIGATEKTDMRDLALRCGPYTDQEKLDLINYCESDVDALARLLPAMLPNIDLPRALLRGRYMATSARSEHAGTPIDVDMLTQLRTHWTGMQDELIARIDRDYGVYEGRTFKTAKFAEWLTRAGIPWPRLESGHLDLSDDAFRECARSHPIVAPLRELRSALSELRLNDLAVGKDGRNRVMLSAFRARTGRNQPSNSRFIFGPSVWLRSLIKPPPGYGAAYIDWAQQEFGIAAALSGDANMIAAYRSGDPYLAFAKLAGAVPPDATKKTHEQQRDLFKACVLAVQYGMGPGALALRIGQPPVVARDLLRAHQETFQTFWKWSDAAVDHAMSMGSLHTVFGWTIHIGADTNPRMLRNFPMQANGAEMLRLACCLATERGIEVCAPVHDAVLICAPLDQLDDDVAGMRAAMAEASRAVLGGFELGTDATAVRYPDRYMDKRGVRMWDEVTSLINQIAIFRKETA